MGSVIFAEMSGNLHPFQNADSIHYEDNCQYLFLVLKHFLLKSKFPILILLNNIFFFFFLNNYLQPTFPCIKIEA